MLKQIQTNHGEERRFRDRFNGDTIREQEIINTVNKGIDQVINDFANGEIENMSTVVIKNKDTNLNIVGQLKMKKGLDSFVVITVMRKKVFIPKPGTSIYEING